MGLLDYLEIHDVGHARKMYDILSTLAARLVRKLEISANIAKSFSGSNRMKHNLLILLKKQWTHGYDFYRTMGAVGAVRVICSLGNFIPNALTL